VGHRLLYSTRKEKEQRRDSMSRPKCMEPEAPTPFFEEIVNTNIAVNGIRCVGSNRQDFSHYHSLPMLANLDKTPSLGLLTKRISFPIVIIKRSIDIRPSTLPSPTFRLPSTSQITGIPPVTHPPIPPAPNVEVIAHGGQVTFTCPGQRRDLFAVAPDEGRALLVDGDRIKSTLCSSSRLCTS